MHRYLNLSHFSTHLVHILVHSTQWGIHNVPVRHISLHFDKVGHRELQFNNNQYARAWEGINSVLKLLIIKDSTYDLIHACHITWQDQWACTEYKLYTKSDTKITLFSHLYTCFTMLSYPVRTTTTPVRCYTCSSMLTRWGAGGWREMKGELMITHTIPSQHHFAVAVVHAVYLLTKLHHIIQLHTLFTTVSLPSKSTTTLSRWCAVASILTQRVTHPYK